MPSTLHSPSTDAPARTTVADRLGVTADTIEATLDFDRPNSREFGPAWTTSEDGWPIVGVSYVTDYRAEEEYGCGDLRRALCGDSPRRFQMLPDRVDHIGLFADVNAIALSVHPLEHTAPTWGDPIGREGDSYAAHWTRSLPHVQRVPDADHLRWRYKMPELRARAKALGITPLPRRKDELLDAIVTHPDLGAEQPNLWPGWFHQGTALILRADNGPAATIISALRDAARAGTLAIGNASGPFSTGLFISDGADIGPAQQARIDADWDWHDARMAELAPVAAQLKAEGYGYYFLGRPRRDGWTTAAGVESTEVRYWLNGHSVRLEDGTRTQPYGWYTLDELANKAFLKPRPRR